MSASPFFSRVSLLIWGLLVAGWLLSGSLGSLFECPRFSINYDISDGRSLKVWSIRRDIFKDFFRHGDFDTDPNPLMIYYRIEQGARELVPTTFLEADDKGDYQFRVVFADQGRLACVYETTRAADNSFFLLMFDAETGESWPRLRDNESRGMPVVLAKWRQRYRQLKAEHPDLPSPKAFDG